MPLFPGIHPYFRQWYAAFGRIEARSRSQDIAQILHLGEIAATEETGEQQYQADQQRHARHQHCSYLRKIRQQ